MCRFKYVTLIILLEIFLPNNPEKYPEASSMNCFPDYEVMDFDEEFHEPLDLLESQIHIGPQQYRHLCDNTGNCRYVKYDTNFYSILRQQLPKFYTHKHYTLSCHAENDTQCQKSELF